jgi:hypothetical protein
MTKTLHGWKQTKIPSTQKQKPAASFLGATFSIQCKKKKKVTNFSQILPPQNNTITLNYHKPKKP